MKIYVLTCINEEGTLVSVEAFTDRNVAFQQMKDEIQAEVVNAEMEEYEDIDHDYDSCSGHVGYGDELYYTWDLSEVEIGETR